MSMARAIWKFPVPVIPGKFSLNLPFGKVLLVQEQNNTLMLWTEVQPGWPDDIRWFEWFGTGHKIPDGVKHVASVQQPPFVWHLYEHTA